MLHSGQRPIHWVWVAPHSSQTKLVRALAMMPSVQPGSSILTGAAFSKGTRPERGSSHAGRGLVRVVSADAAFAWSRRHSRSRVESPPSDRGDGLDPGRRRFHVASASRHHEPGTLVARPSRRKPIEASRSTRGVMEDMEDMLDKTFLMSRRLSSEGICAYIDAVTQTCDASQRRRSTLRRDRRCCFLA